MKINKNIIKELTDYLNEFNLTEIEYTEKDTKIKVSKSTNTVSANSSVATQLTPSLNKETAKPAITGTGKISNYWNRLPCSRTWS